MTQPSVDAWRERLQTLEPLSRALETPPAQHAEHAALAQEWAQTWLEALPAKPAWVEKRRYASGFPAEEVRPGEGPRPFEELLPLFANMVEAGGLAAASGGHCAYIPGGGLPEAAIGDQLAAITDLYAGFTSVGPGAAACENHLLRWLSDLAGLPGTAGGVLTSGGSVATLAAINAAREAHDIRCADTPRRVVYLTHQTHHCVTRALAIAGLREAPLVHVPTDEGERMRPEALSELVARDRSAGRIPWLLVANAGSTDVGAVDPLQELAVVAAAEKLWFHVDAAYGGAFLLVDSMRPLFAGIGAADSLVIDPHKGLFLPYGTGAVLVRDVRTLASAHAYEASYLDDDRHGGEHEPANLGPELSRHWRGPRFWLPLAFHGLARFRAALEEKRLLALLFREEASARGFEVGPPPDLSVVLFRLPGEDAHTHALGHRLRLDGRIFFSGTTLHGQYWLRFAPLSFRTHAEHLELSLAMLDEASERGA